VLQSCIFKISHNLYVSFFSVFCFLKQNYDFFARFLSSLKMYSRFAATFLFRSEKKHRNYVSALFCIHTSLQYIASIFSYAVKYSAILLIPILESSWLMLCRHPVPLSDILCIFFLSDILPYTNRKFRHYSVCILLSSHLLISRSSTNILYSFVVCTDIPCPSFCHFLSDILTSSSRILNHHPVHYYAILLSNIRPFSCQIFCHFLVNYSAVLIFKISPFSCSVF
jgi:hypothetical protein